MRLAVYTDYAYHREEGVIYGERAFTLFLAGLAEQFDRMTLVGRLHPDPGTSRYAIGEGVEFVPLPYYRSLDRILEAGRAIFGASREFWRVLDRVDCVWLLGPNPFALTFALLALLRRKRVVLGVRSDLLAYVRSRHRGRRLLEASAVLLEVAFQLLSRRCPMIAVGPDLARQYGRGSRVLEMVVSLVGEEWLDHLDPAPRGDYDGELRILSVGRLEAEKNPLILADVLALLRAGSSRWRLIVCGEGPMAAKLAERLDELGVADAATLAGYVPLDRGLMELYRSSHVLLHASWTEGLPQVLVEALSAELPVVATDVGGIRAALGDVVRLVPAGDAEAAAEQITILAGDAALRAELTEGGLGYAREHTLEAESLRVAAFLIHGEERPTLQPG